MKEEKMGSTRPSRRTQNPKKGKIEEKKR